MLIANFNSALAATSICLITPSGPFHASFTLCVPGSQPAAITHGLDSNAPHLLVNARKALIVALVCGISSLL